MYLAIARKWRPQKFEDLVGQEHVVQTLKNAIRLKRVAHAYLFSGARGVGKTSVARIFAKALRCPNTKDAIPCNKCEECTAIAESRSVDVVEIDGASNNGVESVRAIRENVVYGAASGFYKVYIIDEVHMLSVSAFNALLKTLEEPPAHVIFLFATTESQKIPLTILSRCQRFEFRRLTQRQLVERLTFISKEEGQSFSKEALEILATQSDGSLRDALSLLDQVFSFLGGEKINGTIEETKVVEALGISKTTQVSQWLTHVVRKEVPQVLALIDEIYRGGMDLKHFADKCLEELRLLYLIKLSQDNQAKVSAESLDISSSQFETLSALGTSVSLLQLERMAQILVKTAGDLSWCSLPRFVFEMASVRMNELDGIAEEASEVVTPVVAPKVPAQPMATPKAAKVSAPPAVAQAAPPPPQQPAPQVQMSPENQSWRGFVDSVMKKRPLLGALLSHAKFKMDFADSKKKVILSFEEGSFYEGQASEKRNRAEIESLVKQFFGPQAVLILSNQKEGIEPSLEEKHQGEIAEIKQKALSHPGVRKTQEILGADIVDVSVE